MSSGEDRPGWGNEPERAPGTGRRLAPEAEETGPLYDPLVDPLPSERVPESQRPATTDVYPRPRPGAGRRGTTVRRTRRMLRRIDPISVLKLSLFFYACLLVAWLLFVAIVYSFLDSLGLFDLIDEVARGFALGENVGGGIELILVERWSFLVGLTLAVAGTIVNVVLAILYNFAAARFGGIEMTFVEREL